MSRQFDVNAYWLERGRRYMEENRTPAEFHRLQERFLLDVLRSSALPMTRILEIGCGFGRITRLLEETWPQAHITALDLSPEQLANARRYCGEKSRVHFAQYDFYSTEPLPGNDFDCILAIEVFLHHPPQVVSRLIKRLALAAGHFVNIDWSERWPWPTPEHVWIHNFTKVYTSAGLACATFPLPEKVDYKQQKLFVAGRDLSPTIRELEEQVGRAFTEASERRLRLPASDSAGDWMQQLQLALTELQQVIPRGETLILVDDAHWGWPSALDAYRVIPFLEHEGQYWGAPANDTQAWNELQRLRVGGAQWIAFAWPSFWWLDHYQQFHERLRCEFPCILRDERLVVFRLAKG